ncbi:hypothetical protein [Pelagicoccus mobilis]|uniref:Uncharacterized protein n=1 Tax=Pelagicoccus mobilis TaxID=415221 RepID=A0A934VLQ3_9BACT|nr:hypothetical protein [Pelagicoccus mobilis]MBK1878001.1 hypothetical protein [Pelagicoccus mobilis]
MKYLGIDLSDADVSLTLWDRAAGQATQYGNCPIATAVKRRKQVAGEAAFELLASTPNSVCVPVLAGRPTETIEEGRGIVGTRAEQLVFFLENLLKEERLALAEISAVGISVDASLDEAWLEVIAGVFQKSGVENVSFFSRAALVAGTALRGSGDASQSVSVFLNDFSRVSSSSRFERDGEMVVPSGDVQERSLDLVSKYPDFLKSVLSHIREQFRLDLRRADPEAMLALFKGLSQSLLNPDQSFSVGDYVPDVEEERFDLASILRQSDLGSELQRGYELLEKQATTVVCSGLNGAVSMLANETDGGRTYVSGKDVSEVAAYAISWVIDEAVSGDDIMNTVSLVALEPRPEPARAESEPEVVAEPKSVANPKKVVSPKSEAKEVFSSDSRWFAPATPEKLLFQGWLFDFREKELLVSSGTRSSNGGLVVGTEYVDFEGELLRLANRSGRAFLTPLTNRLRFLRNSKRVESEVEVFVGDIIEIESTNVLMMLSRDS